MLLRSETLVSVWLMRMMMSVAVTFLAFQSGLLAPCLSHQPATPHRLPASQQDEKTENEKREDKLTTNN